ncbi:hypothetical protein [Anaerotignum sp.]|nr:hypothetical protein [Anaerotignum sp.]
MRQISLIISLDLNQLTLKMSEDLLGIDIPMIYVYLPHEIPLNSLAVVL